MDAHPLDDVRAARQYLQSLRLWWVSTVLVLATVAAVFATGEVGWLVLGVLAAVPGIIGGANLQRLSVAVRTWEGRDTTSMTAGLGTQLTLWSLVLGSEQPRAKATIAAESEPG